MTAAAEMTNLVANDVLHKDGSLWARGQTLDGEMHAYWEWFRKGGGAVMRSPFNTASLEAAHEHCCGNEPEVPASQEACCIACARPFQAKLATETAGQGSREFLTVFCPVCDLDAVIGDRSGYPVADADFIAAMNQRYFKEPYSTDGAWKELLDAQN